MSNILRHFLTVAAAWSSILIAASFCLAGVRDDTVGRKPTYRRIFLEQTVMAKQSSTSIMDRALAQIAAARIHPDTLLTVKAIEMLTGLSRPSLYRHAKAGVFPAPVMPGRWHGGAVLKHLARKASSNSVIEKSVA
ncbi:hypothetical protein G7047_04925 [Diaphorobacter sp. HDW4A]|uniref:helix-turn-helix transcriptional regulator n=1 Tax=Diaphorobacter sp. HDW4A TaxID=2714924 RepID=UPI00140A8525|nr:hypothetical protein [Diaphorobacter sp. HDW4A]QIL79321.1 hypothetical protein G7047_04925 [Diaphorobacter sp. HDW4A]